MLGAEHWRMDKSMMGEKINLSSLSQVIRYGFVFVLLFLISGCYAQKSHDAEADLLLSILSPSEGDEKTEARRLMDIYEIKGFLTNEPILHESAWGAAYVPHLELDVEEIIKIDLKEEGLASTKSTKNEYLKITCRQISEDYHGIYQMGETTSNALTKTVSIQGSVYRCGCNWYICEKDEIEIYCDADGKKAYDSTHVQLINFKTDIIRKSK